MLDLREGLRLGFEEEITAVLRSVAGEAAALKPSLADQIVACWREWGADPGRDETEDEREATERLLSRRSDLIDAAEALPATSSNLLPKALALAWIGFVELQDIASARSDHGSDGRLALDIDAAIGGRVRTGA